MTSVRQYFVDFAGAIMLTGLLFIAGDSQSRNELLTHGRGHGSAPAPKPADDPVGESDLASGAPWREVAEGIETRGNYDGVLSHLARVIDRETGTRQAEARLWRAAFLDRHGLDDVAAAVFDSLLVESSRFPLRLRLAVAGTAFEAALHSRRTAAAEDLLGRWLELRRTARNLQASEVFLPPSHAEAGDRPMEIPEELLRPAIDSLEARLHLGLGLQLIRDRRDSAARLQLETALALGLVEPAALEARVRLALMDAWHDSTEVSHAPLEALADDPRLPEVRPDLAYVVSLELADAFYRAARYAEARDRYALLLPAAVGSCDSAWMQVQLADASARLGDGVEARHWYGEYLARWPNGVWSAWARFAAADVGDVAALDTLRAVP